MITVSIKIDRPLDIVWEYFTNPANWSKWYGGALKEVIPGWQAGAELVWEIGGSSPITNFSPKKLIQISGGWTDMTFRFQASGSSATLVEIIESAPKRGAFFTEGGVAEKAQLEEILQKLKMSIESETVVNEEVRNKEKSWWKKLFGK